MTAPTNTDLMNRFKDAGQFPAQEKNKLFQGQSANPSQETQTRTPPQFWANVGIQRVNPETGETVLVSLPMGIALDKSPEIEVPGEKSKNIEYRMLQVARADLWNQVKQLMSTLKPGEVVQLPFQVEIRRVDEKKAPDLTITESNPFAVGNLFTKAS